MLKRFYRDKAALAGLLIIIVVIAAGLLAPWVAPADPTAVNVEHKLLSPSPDYPLGTDQLGRCIFPV